MTINKYQRVTTPNIHVHICVGVQTKSDKTLPTFLWIQLWNIEFYSHKYQNSVEYFIKKRFKNWNKI